MVDVAAFEEKPAHDVRAGERLWVNGEALLVKRVEAGPTKSGLTFHFRGRPSKGINRFAMVKVTSA